MKFSTYMTSAVYFLSALAVGALSLTESADAFLIGAVLTAMLLSLILNIKKKRLLPPLFWNAFAVLIFALYAADYFFVSKSLIAASTRFLTILLALKLFDLNTNRDYVTAFGIVFFEILASTASTTSPFFFVIISLFILSSIFAMILFNVKRDWTEKAFAASNEPPPDVFNGRFFIWLATVSIVTLAFGFIFFFILPRVGVGLFDKKTLDTIKVAGFSENVDLGSIGPVKKDQTIIMRARIASAKENKTPPGLRFRGTALDRYDGKAWTRTFKASRVKIIRKDSGGDFVLSGHALAPEFKNKAIAQEIILEPLETDVIFGAEHPALISGKFTALRLDDGGAVYLPVPAFSRLEYTVWSIPGPLESFRGEPLQKYSETSSLSERMQRLTADITKNIIVDFDKAKAIEAYLKINYAYTLDPKKGAGETPLDDFLFYAKEGYCEHFATSMTLMLRLAGIPARLVTGFLPGQWNNLGDYFIVRQSDAHSWVEALINYNGKQSWVTFDPTPPAGIAPFEKQSKFFLYLDLIKWRWSRYVVNYSFSDQKKMTETFEINARNLLSAIKSALTASRQINGKFILAVAVAAVLMLSFIYYYLSKGAGKIGDRNKKTPEFYVELLSVLKKQGLTKHDFETSLEFSKRANNPAVTEITLLFNGMRYGGLFITPDDDARLRRLLKELRSKKGAWKYGAT